MSMYAKIGCEAYIVRDGQILLGKRGNVTGQGTWALPGGHLEHLERADACLIREMNEEMGLVVAPTALRLIALTDDLEPSLTSHYVHITFAVNIGDQEPQLLEPDACDEWRWFPVGDMPSEIFRPHAKILHTIRSGQVYAPQAA